jgi:hypothetical protein
MHAHIDPEQQEHIRIVKAVARMRRNSLFAFLLLALSAMLVAAGFFAWGEQNVFVLLGMAIGIVSIFTVAYIKFLKPACPACGTILMPSGKFSIGTLDRPRCAGCGVSFEMNRR